MTITTIHRKGKKYLYITLPGSKRLYLGHAESPQKDRIERAISHLNDKVKKYQDEIQELLRTFKKEEGNYKVEYRLVLFDLDGVIFNKPWYDDSSQDVAISTWDMLFKELGIYPGHEKLKQKFIEGKFKSYMEWTEAACIMIKQLLDKTIFEDLINQRKLTLGSKEVFSILTNQKIKTALITGSFYELAKRAMNELGNIDYILAHCKFKFDKTGSLESWELKETDYQHKAKFVKTIAEQNNIPLDQCAYVGDDVNDLKVFEIVGRSIAFNANKTIVQKAADVVVNSNDLRDILPHLSYHSKS